MKNAVSVIALSLFAVLCGVGAIAGEVTVVFIPKVTGNAFFESANAGAQKYAAEIGFKVIYDGRPEASIDNQAEIIANAISSRADAICLSSVDAWGLDEAMQEAMRAGVKAVTWDSDVSGDSRSIMVSQGTPEILGRMLVDMGAQSLAERGEKPEKDTIRYVWHYSQSTVADQNSWQIAGEAYIREKYPNWINVAPTNYYSEQNPALALEVGAAILARHVNIDLVICNDSTALPGQCQAAQNMGRTKKDLTITGFSSPNPIKEFARAGVIQRWGLWDCRIQGAMGCYVAYLLASGKQIRVGDKIDFPDIGMVEVLPNTVLDPEAYTAPDSGVVLLPERSEFTLENMDEYDF